MSVQRFLSCLRFPLSLVLAGSFLGPSAPRTRAADHPPLVSPRRFQPAEDEFAAVNRSVVVLLQRRDTARFASEIAPSVEDWKAIASTNVSNVAENLKGFADRATEQGQEAEAAARTLLAKADLLHLDFSKGDLHPRDVTPPRFGQFGFGNVHYPALQAQGETIPSLRQLEIILNPDAYTNSAAGGEFKIVLRHLNKFPNGWRAVGGIQWAAFPTNVADEKTLREMAILDKAANSEGLREKDDPALLRLGQMLVRFIRERDTNFYAKEVLVNADLVWAQMQKSGENGPPRQELDQEMDRVTKEQTEIARSLLHQNDAAGIDLTDAQIQIKEASVERVQAPGMSGSLNGLTGEQFKLKLAVKADGKSKTGTSLSGDYILAVNQVTRFTDDWKVARDVRWYRVPAGVLDDKAAAAMEFENYVTEHGSLPPGSTAPEIEFTTLNGETKMKLSDLRGKIVVLDFWATWCGPCQGPMADLQELSRAHSDWEKKVAIVPLSIDDTLDVVRQHVNKRGWTNTFNVWAGDGGWRSAPAKAFRVSGVPTTYIIDFQGKIVTAGHPAGMAIDDKVAAVLSATKE